MRTINYLLILILSILHFAIHEKLSAQDNPNESHIENYTLQIEEFENQFSFNHKPKRIKLFDKSTVDTTIYLLDSLIYTSFIDDRKKYLTYDHGNNEVNLINQYLDTNSFTWINEDEISRVYDTGGNLLSETRRIWNVYTNQFNNISLYEYNYDQNKRLLLRKDHYWDFGEKIWFNNKMEQFKYDLRGFLVERLETRWDSNLLKWINILRKKIAYNSLGKVTMNIYEEWSSNKNNWQPNFRNYYSYDIHGNRISELYQYLNYENMELYNFCATKNEYVNNLIVKSSMDYFKPSGEITNKNRFTYDYYESGEQKLIQSATFNFITKTWENNSRTSFTYGMDNSNTKLVENWNPTNLEWENQARWIYKSDQNNNLIYELRESWSQQSESWKNVTRKVCDFDENNNLITFTFEGWVGSNWLPAAYTVRIDNDRTEIFAYASKLSAYYSPIIKNKPDVNFKEPKFQLSQNYPNPFNPITVITFEIPKLQYVTIIIYNSLGEKISMLVDGLRTEGTYKEIFNGTHLPSGVYFYQISTGSFNQVKKMLLLK